MKRFVSIPDFLQLMQMAGDKNTIFVKESFTGTEHGQCSKGDFESGNCQLYYQGKRVMDIYGCKRPKK